MKKLLKMFRKEKHTRTKHKKTEKQETSSLEQTQEAADSIPQGTASSADVVQDSSVRDSGAGSQTIDHVVAGGGGVQPVSAENTEHSVPSGSSNARENVAQQLPAGDASTDEFNEGSDISVSGAAALLDANASVNGATSAEMHPYATPIYESVDFGSDRSSVSLGALNVQMQGGEISQTANASEIAPKEVLESSRIRDLSVDSAGYLKPARGKQKLAARVRAFFRDVVHTFASLFQGKKGSKATRNLFDDLIVRTPRPHSSIESQEAGASATAVKVPTSPTHSSNEFSYTELEQSPGISRRPGMDATAQGDLPGVAGPSGLQSTGQARSSVEPIISPAEQSSREDERDQGVNKAVTGGSRSTSSSDGSFVQSLLRTFDEFDAISISHSPVMLDSANPSATPEPQQPEQALLHEEQRLEVRQDSTPVSHGQQPATSGTHSTSSVPEFGAREGSSTDPAAHIYNLGNSMNDRATSTSQVQKREEELLEPSKTSQTREASKVGKSSSQLLNTISGKLSHILTPEKSPKKSAPKESPKAEGKFKKLTALSGFTRTLNQKGITAAAMAFVSGAGPFTSKKTAQSSKSDKALAAFQILLGRSPNDKGHGAIPMPAPASSRVPNLADPQEGKKRLESITSTSSENGSQHEEPIYARSTKSSTTSSPSSVYYSESEDFAPPLPPRPHFDTMNASKKKISQSSLDRVVLRDIDEQEVPQYIAADSATATRQSVAQVPALVRRALDFGETAATLNTVQQEAMDDFSSYASLPSSSAETSPERPATQRPTKIARSPALASLSMPSLVEQPSVSAKTTPGRRKALKSAIISKSAAMLGISMQDSPTVTTVDRPERPATCIPTMPSGSPIMTGSSMPGPVEQPSSFSVKPAATAGNSHVVSAVTAVKGATHAVDPMTKKLEMPLARVIAASAVAAKAEVIASPAESYRTSKLPNGLLPASPSPVRTQISILPEAHSGSSKSSGITSPVSLTKSRTAVSVLPDLGSKPRVSTISSTSSTISVKEQVSNWPSVSSETVRKAPEVGAFAGVKRSTRVLKNTSPRIQHRIEKLFDDAERSSGSVSSVSTSASSSSLSSRSVSDFTQNKPGASVKQTPSASNFIPIRGTQNAVIANGDRDTLARSKNSVYSAVKRIESCLLSERKSISSAGKARRSINASSSVSRPMHKESQYGGSASGSNVSALVSRFSSPKGSKVNELVSQFSSPKGSKVNELVRKFEGKHSAAVAVETSKQQRGR